MNMHIPRVGVSMYEGLNQNQIPFEPAEWFPELDLLQESGEINMMGAPRWLRENFGFNRDQANTIFKAWVEYKS